MKLLTLTVLLASAGICTGQDLAISVRVEGAGMLRLARDGRVVYIKQASLSLVKGKLGVQDATLLPSINVPQDVTDLKVDPDGTVKIASSGKRLGRIVLAIFKDEGKLKDSAGFLISAERPTPAFPGDGDTGLIETVKSTSSPPIKSYQPVGTNQQVKTPSTGARPTITIRPISEVDGERFTLGEIAEIQADSALEQKLGEVVIGDSPITGVQRGIDRIRIVARLKAAGHKPEEITITVPTGAKVARKGQTIQPERFLHAAITGAVERLGGSWQASQSNSSLPMAIPAGEVVLKAETVSKGEGSCRVSVGVYVSGRRFNSRTIALSGTEAPLGVRSGAKVRALVRSNGAVVEITATARKSARVGEQVEVVTDAGVALVATVIQIGVVEVKL